MIITPSAASTYVATASGSGLDVINETLTASMFSAKLSAQAGGSGYGELVDELLEAIKSISIREVSNYTIKYQSKDPAGMRAELKQFITDAITLSKNLAGYDGYKKWIVDMITEVAKTKTGGILGFGGESIIDDKEQAAIDELSALMDA